MPQILRSPRIFLQQQIAQGADQVEEQRCARVPDGTQESGPHVIDHLGRQPADADAQILRGLGHDLRRAVHQQEHGPCRRKADGGQAYARDNDQAEQGVDGALQCPIVAGAEQAGGDAADPG